MPVIAPVNATMETYYGRVTATRDWCEQNGVVVPWILEFWNTMTSGFMMSIGLYAAWLCKQHGTPTRFILSHLCLAFVGFGSVLFHATLLRPMQLLDELPMMYGTLVFLYAVIQRGRPGLQNRSLLALLAALAVMLTLATLVSTDAHHIMYGFMAAYLIYQSNIMRKENDVTSARALITIAVSMYILGSVLWAIENMYCHNVQSMQLHAWWHVLSGSGTVCYLTFVNFHHLHLLKKEPKLRHKARVFPMVVHA